MTWYQTLDSTLVALTLLLDIACYSGGCLTSTFYTAARTPVHTGCYAGGSVTCSDHTEWILIARGWSPLYTCDEQTRQTEWIRIPPWLATRKDEQNKKLSSEWSGCGSGDGSIEKRCCECGKGNKMKQEKKEEGGKPKTFGKPMHFILDVRFARKTMTISKDEAITELKCQLFLFFEACTTTRVVSARVVVVLQCISWSGCISTRHGPAEDEFLRMVRESRCEDNKPVPWRTMPHLRNQGNRSKTSKVFVSYWYCKF